MSSRHAHFPVKKEDSAIASDVMQASMKAVHLYLNQLSNGGDAIPYIYEMPAKPLAGPCMLDMLVLR